MTSHNGTGGTSREIKRLATIARGETDELRVSWDEFTPDRGQPSRYLSLRVFYEKDGQWLPTRKGVTVRRGELAEVRAALGRVLDGLARQGDAQPETAPKREPAQEQRPPARRFDDPPDGETLEKETARLF
ncbi:MAG: transcriptional coactivator p15/PC4 family protein [Polyangiaceae bacterium]|nr:transcriptional coactivator p15/PC4 family protein [Polyangiaceae bacterium]